MSTKDYPEDFPDKLDYALHTLSPTQRIAFESWAPKHEREDAKADAAVLSEVFGTSLTPQEPSAELKARVMAQVAHTEQIQPANELGTDDVNAGHKSDHADSEGYFVSDNTDNTQAIAGSEDSAYARAKRHWFGAQGKFSPSRMMGFHAASATRTYLPGASSREGVLFGPSTSDSCTTWRPVDRRANQHGS